MEINLLLLLGKLYQTLLFILFDNTTEGVITLKKKKNQTKNWEKEISFQIMHN